MVFEFVRVHSRLSVLNGLRSVLGLLRKTRDGIGDISFVIRVSTFSDMIGQESER
jgi:hypothetical protein